VDPKAFTVHGISKMEVVRQKAGEALPGLVDRLLKEG